ncbi:MAG: MoaA/NifB/PqqE/SkfB family radical SAM enzyme [Desulforhopalus sp.]|jgi:MoaA/NifB/PqqE/SkfB family radical SAM enzyme
MKNIAFGYSTRCNITCRHCVAAGEQHDKTKMELQQAKNSINELAATGVTGISFTAGEPTLYFDDLLELIELCTSHKIYTRVVTNSFWAKDVTSTKTHIAALRDAGLCQLRLSYSRWHQEYVPAINVCHAARECLTAGIDYFVSFVTDFSEKDETYEQFLRDNSIKFFPEPLIYSGRAKNYLKEKLFTDYHDNRCAMNCYLAPDFNMYACCDAGSHFTKTKAFLLGNLKDESAKTLFAKYDSDPLYHCIRNIGLSAIASYSGMSSREIVTFRKCELCEKLLNHPETYNKLRTEAQHHLQNWHR